MDGNTYWNRNIFQLRKKVVEPIFQDSNKDMKEEMMKFFSIRNTRLLANIYERCTILSLNVQTFKMPAALRTRSKLKVENNHD